MGLTLTDVKYIEGKRSDLESLMREIRVASNCAGFSAQSSDPRVPNQSVPSEAQPILREALMGYYKAKAEAILVEIELIGINVDAERKKLNPPAESK